MQKMESLKEQATKYTHYQEIFKVAVSRYEELEEVYVDLTNKKMLWQSLHEWTGLMERWCEMPFESIDAEEISAKAQHYSKVVFQLEKSLIENMVVPKLKYMVDSFKVGHLFTGYSCH